MRSDDFITLLKMLPQATGQTLYMTLVSTLFACILGFPLGAFLFSASPVGLCPSLY